MYFPIASGDEDNNWAECVVLTKGRAERATVITSMWDHQPVARSRYREAIKKLVHYISSTTYDSWTSLADAKTGAAP